MLVIGAGGFAKQLLDVFDQLELISEIVLFDDVTIPTVDKLYDRFPVIHTEKEVAEHFQIDNRFVLGMGNPEHRLHMATRFTTLGGELVTIVSPKAHVSSISCEIGKGVTILTGAIIENGVSIGMGSLINLGCFITHDNVIGKFTEISPGVRLSGHCMVGDYCFIGTGAVIIPGVRIGNRAVIAAGSVVIEDVPDSVTVAGVPAKIKKKA